MCDTLPEHDANTAEAFISNMLPYKIEFIELALEIGVLKFGEFELKSGRRSPYFFNSGLFNTGYAAAKLGRAYAATVAQLDAEIDVLFGPAYKGIPLVALTAATLAERHDIDLPFCFNRKEEKDHGEGGNIVGAPLAGRVLILDDVITAGTAIGEAVQIIRKAGATPAGVVIALDRQERGNDGRSAVQEVEQTYDMPVTSIIGLDDLIDHLETSPEHTAALPAVERYRDEFGV